jgi:hypothetical protein
MAKFLVTRVCIEERTVNSNNRRNATKKANTDDSTDWQVKTVLSTAQKVKKI